MIAALAALGLANVPAHHAVSAARRAGTPVTLTVSVPVDYGAWGQDSIAVPVTVRALSPYGDVVWHFVSDDDRRHFRELSYQIRNELEAEALTALYQTGVRQ